MTEERRPLAVVVEQMNYLWTVMVNDLPIAQSLIRPAADAIAGLLNSVFSTRAQEIKADTEAWLSTRLIGWLKSTPRKPANIAFTEGPLRLMAYAIEEAVRGSRTEALEECCKRICDLCDLGWIVETAEHGSYHRVPPKNEPTVILNRPCKAAAIRKAKEGV